jgi:hypothetical protein
MGARPSAPTWTCAYPKPWVPRLDTGWLYNNSAIFGQLSNLRKSASASNHSRLRKKVRIELLERRGVEVGVLHQLKSGMFELVLLRQLRTKVFQRAHDALTVFESHAKRNDERVMLEDVRRATKVEARTLLDLLS